MNNNETNLIVQNQLSVVGEALNDMEGPSLMDHNPNGQVVAKPVGISGSMSGSMEGPSLSDSQNYEAIDAEVGLAIGTMNGMIAFRITHPSGEEILMMFTVEQMRSIMLAQQNAIDLLNYTKN